MHFWWLMRIAPSGKPVSSCAPCPNDARQMKKLSHYDRAGTPRMVDVSGKATTTRTARAHAFVRIAPRVLAKLSQNPKGDPLGIARIAGIAAAKKTSDLIPLCHPLMLTHVDVNLRV